MWEPKHHWLRPLLDGLIFLPRTKRRQGLYNSVFPHPKPYPNPTDYNWLTRQVGTWVWSPSSPWSALHCLVELERIHHRLVRGLYLYLILSWPTLNLHLLNVGYTMEERNHAVKNVVVTHTHTFRPLYRTRLTLSLCQGLTLPPTPVRVYVTRLGGITF